MKTVSNLGQNLWACLPAIAGKDAFAVLVKPGGFHQGELEQTALRPGYQLIPSRAPRLYPQGGGVDHVTEIDFWSVKLLIFFAGQPGPVMTCRLSGRQVANKTQARWVST